MSEEQLTCTRIVERTDFSRRLDGSIIKWHERCGERAEVRALVGGSFAVEDVLCFRHYQEAVREIEKQRKGRAPRVPDPRQGDLLADK
jgi:hypothetical protein